MRQCSKCKAVKDESCFTKKAAEKDGLYRQCKSCVKEYAALYRSRPESVAAKKAYKARPDVREKAREYMRHKLADPAFLLEHRARSTAANKSAASKAAKLRYQKTHPNGSYAKCANDPLFKTSLNFRRLLLTGLKANRLPKTSKAENYLGCDFEFFHLYLEMQFAPGMSWANVGEWQVDHIKPISKAFDDDSFRALSSYKNLQPMWAAYNNAKKNKTPEQWAKYVSVNKIDVKVRPCSIQK